MILSLPKHYSNILSKVLKKFVKEGRTSFYLEDLVDESKVPLNYTETFLIPLLKKDQLEGKLEVRCPKCRRDQGLYDRMSQIPSEFTCDICDFEFQVERESLQIVLEVKGDFFRNAIMTEPLVIKCKPTKQELLESLDKSLKEKKDKKGREFENFFEGFMNTQENFEFSFKHPRTAMGEIDYVYTHKLENSFWKMFSYICVECKNWKENISSVEMGHLGDLVEEKFPFPCIGIYITTSNYDPSAFEVMKKYRLKNNIVLVPIDGKQIKDLVENGFENTVKRISEYIFFKSKKG